MAQINFSAGYRAGWTNPEVFNQIIDDYNEESNILPDIGHLSYLNGVDVSVKYLTPGLTYEVGWKNKRKSLRPSGTNGNKDNNTITPSIHSFCFGLHPSFGRVSIGGTIDYNLMKVRKRFDLGPIPDTKSINSDAWSSHFSLSINFSNGGMIGLTVQPYIQIYWSEYDLNALYWELNGPLPAQTSYLDKINTIGIALIVNNGQQPSWK